MTESVKLVKRAVKIPVVVKLSGTFAHITKEWAAGVRDAGADGIAASDALGPALDIDVVTGEPVLGGPRGVGGLTGPGIMPITLRMVLEIAMTVDLPVIGLPGAFILGFLAGALALIPTVGPATATTIAAIVAWTQGSTYLGLSNLAITLLVVIIFAAIQFFEGFWLTPRIMSRRLNLHPGLVLIAIVGTLFTLGALMALIIVPLLSSLDLIFRYARSKRAGLDPWAYQESAQIPSEEEHEEHKE